MHRYYLAVFFAFLLHLLTVLPAWSGDSLRHSKPLIGPEKPREEIVQEFPTLRLVDVQFEYALPTDYTAKQNDGRTSESGRLRLDRVKVALNFPFYQKEEWWFGVSARYRYGYNGFSKVDYSVSDVPALHYGPTLATHFYTTGLHGVRMSSLFNKRLIYSLGVSIEGSEKTVERFVGNLLAVMYLGKTKNTQFTLGAFGRFCKGMGFPFIPFVGIEQKLPGSWTFSAALPKHIYFRIPVSRCGRLSLGVEADADAYYMYPEGTEKVYIFRTIALKSGFVYEYLLPKKFVFSLRGGGVNTLNAGIIGKNDSFGDRIVKHSQDMTWFLNTGISYTLF